ncbi:MAG TPA: ABC transporter substrate-binding protein [Caulobacteraceae bacterium]|jgi:NitT/TauT family transport system substrate-binding protein
MADRNRLWGGLAALAGTALLAACSPAKKAETASSSAPTSASTTAIRFATDWHAQAEQGGFYEALAEGEYKKRGLDVTIVQGGPAVNVPQLLASGAVDMGMGSNSFIVLNLAAEKAPVKAVAAFMQKDPQVLMAHPDDSVSSFADMKGRPILISDASVTAWWPWLKTKFGFTDDQVRKYTHNNATFLADKRAIQEGYITSEPYTLKKEGHIEPKVFLLADAGYPGYAAMALATDKLIASNPAAVKAFVEASAKGWHDYLYGDPKPADAVILKDNPDMTQDVLDQARDKMRQAGLVDGGDAKAAGIGIMTDKRWAEAFQVGAGAGVYPKAMDYQAGYTLKFVTPAP